MILVLVDRCESPLFIEWYQKRTRSLSCAVTKCLTDDRIVKKKKKKKKKKKHAFLQSCTEKRRLLKLEPTFKIYATKMGFLFSMKKENAITYTRRIFKCTTPKNIDSRNWKQLLPGSNDLLVPETWQATLSPPKVGYVVFSFFTKIIKRVVSHLISAIWWQGRASPKLCQTKCFLAIVVFGWHTEDWLILRNRKAQIINYLP